MRLVLVVVGLAGCLDVPPAIDPGSDGSGIGGDSGDGGGQGDSGDSGDGGGQGDAAAPVSDAAAGDFVAFITWTKTSGSCPTVDVSPNRFRLKSNLLFRFENDCGLTILAQQARWEAGDVLVLDVGHDLQSCDLATMESLSPFSINFDETRTLFEDVVFTNIDRTTVEGSYVCTISYKMEQAL